MEREAKALFFRQKFLENCLRKLVEMLIFTHWKLVEEMQKQLIFDYIPKREHQS